MKALLIGARERAAIADLVAKAVLRPMPLENVQRAAAHKQKTGDAHAPMNQAATIEIPLGFFVTYTHEEQPGGMCRHMSVSVAGSRGSGPNPHAVALLMEEFGFKNAFGSAPMWLDTLKNGTLVINVLEPLDGNLEHLRK